MARYNCNHCEETFSDDNAELVCTDVGDRHHPAEYQMHCPHCGWSDFQEEEG